MKSLLILLVLIAWIMFDVMLAFLFGPESLIFKLLGALAVVVFGPLAFCNKLGD